VAAVELLVVVQNLGRGGLKSGAGVPEDRWPQLAERLTSVGQPDIALLQEAGDGWATDSHQQLVRAEGDLDMDALPLPPSRSGLGPAMLYRRETMGRRIGWNTDFARDEMHHGMGVAAWNVGLPAPLAAASIHLTPYAAGKAVDEADFAASRAYKFGPYAIVGGDVNFSAQAGPEPNYAEMRPYNRGSRLELTDPENPQPDSPDRRIAWTLAQNGLVDVAWYLYKESGDERLLRHTGTDDRIDQVWVSAPLAPAIVDYQLLDTPAAASDHHGLAVRLNLDLAVTDDPWTYR
jgi:endonuclease/exonuclease/phosphatase family metal-dependent hydrolase